MASPTVLCPTRESEPRSSSNAPPVSDHANHSLLGDNASNPGPVLSIIIPTFNERDNINLVVDALSNALHDIDWEAIFVDDDSPDNTASVVRQIGLKHARVRCVHRIGRRGLSAACVEGMLTSSAPYLALMDGDLQHDPAVVRRMVEILDAGEAELVVGSRYINGDDCDGLSKTRHQLSRFAARLSRLVLSERLTDPMSNFFALRQELFHEVVRGLSKLSFKILLDILLTARRRVRVREIPYVLGIRKAGQSKFEAQVAWEYVMLLIDKVVGRYIPVRFVAFSAIGATGAGVHLATLAVAYRALGVDFVTSAVVATAVSIVFNYTLNNALTYRDRRRHGMKWLTGLCSFAIVCSIGAAANVGLAAYLFNQRADWLLAAVAGVLVGAVWNYSATSFYTWGRSS
ncbi:glycosyltransferase [Peristeroidobacter agariperforans]|uniref:glycosyltransferase n=1 Tax=Peristeroidobacter agariperforans TaxID=268404 RepID=UPI00101DB4FC|nr:glycosyltransferase family 2 protein [Peristeroidobacter agariperforans]